MGEFIAAEAAPAVFIGDATPFANPPVDAASAAIPSPTREPDMTGFAL
jgi:hypothetical protein